uniref:1-acyl-sn-glycerol-3-phosphate acyltransferase n=2 Tax=Anas zonorhyncha TaxID=75864 RepID=A0A8B9VPQ8_9AVES
MVKQGPKAPTYYHEWTQIPPRMPTRGPNAPSSHHGRHPQPPHRTTKHLRAPLPAPPQPPTSLPTAPGRPRPPSPCPPRLAEGRAGAGRTAHIRRGQPRAKGWKGPGFSSPRWARGLGGVKGREESSSMELGWLLWGAAVLLLLPVLMELSPAVNFALRIGFYYLLFFVCSALTAPVCLLVNGGRTVKNMRIIKTVVKTFKYFFGLRFEVKGLENFEVEGPAIIVSNHQSILDMMGLMEVLPDNCVQVGKKELMYAGTVGLIIYLGGVIFINRKSTSSAKMVMAEVAKTMATDNVKVWVYPEGTRNCTGDLLPFKKGAFHVAVQAQVPVIPVVYSSFTTFYNPKKNLFTSGKIKVEVLPPIETKGLTSDDVSELTDRCYRIMRETLFRLSGRPGEVKDSS